MKDFLWMVLIGALLFLFVIGGTTLVLFLAQQLGEAGLNAALGTLVISLWIGIVVALAYVVNSSGGP